jgi:hypothetical protein
MIRSLILIGIYFLSIYSSCNKSIFCNQNTYSFLANFTASPAIDSIAINDTVWITMNESTQLQDLSTNNVVDFSNAANLSFVFGMRKVISATVFLPAADSFRYFVRKGVNVSAIKLDILREFKLVEEVGRYKLEVGFIPLKKGIYSVLIENSSNVYTRDKPCDKADFAVKFTNADQHFYLGYNIYGDGVYYFKVY